MSLILQTFPIRSILIGKVKVLKEPELMSAILKQAVSGKTTLDLLGLAGDEQADSRVHGGVDKAVHFYAYSHYELWRKELGDLDVLRCTGAFGENFSVYLTEHEVCIGDIWQIGNTKLQVSQGRQPCWKLNIRFAVPDMSSRVQQTLRAGWYCSVLESGEVSIGDSMQLLHRPHPDWTIARLLATIRDRECSPHLLRDILQLPLTPSWRKLFQHRVSSQTAEDWSKRMQG